MNAWIKRKYGYDEVISILVDEKCPDATLVFNLYIAFVDNYLGRILFDKEGYWIYDGEELTVTEQEQVGKFICHHMQLFVTYDVIFN